MRSPYANVSVFSIFLLLFITESASSQTATDTASVITGTVMRGIPNVEPVKPQPLEIKEAFFTTSNKVSRKKQKAELMNKSVKTIESFGDTDTALVKAYRNSQLAYYYSIEKRNISNAATFDSITAYYAWALQNRQQIINRQQITGSIIFILVVFLVLSGLLFSGIQFYIALKSAKRKGSLPSTSLKASFSGIEVSSSVLGVIILTLSIAFFICT